MKKSIFIFIIIVFWIGNSSTSAQIKLATYVVGNGGAVISGSSNILSVTIGQPIIGNASNSLHSNNMGFWYQYANTITDVDEGLMFETPKEFELFQNYPNPFNPTTIIKYGLPKESSVKVNVYNILGEMIITLVDNVQETGYYEVDWNAANNSSGIYFYRIQAGDYVETKKMVLLR